MSKELKHKIHSPTDCLSEKMLFDYIDSKLTPKEQHIVEKHLLDCELCSDALQGLEITKDRGRIKQINDIINKRISSSSEKEVKIISFNYKFAVSIAATIALLVIGVFFFNKISLKEADLAELNEEEAHPAATSSPMESTGKLLERWDSVSTGTKSAQDESASFKTVIQQPVTTADSKTSPYKSAEGDIIRNNTGSGESTTEVPTDATLMDDRESATALPEESVNLPQAQGGAIEREDNSKSDAAKGKAEEKSVTANRTYWAEPKSADQKNAESKNNNINNLESQTDLSKKTAKDTKYRTESKKKTKARSTVTKESGVDEDNAPAQNDKNVTTEPKSFSQTTDEIKKSEVAFTTTTKVIADSADYVFSFAEVQPEFVGGNDSLMKFIRINFKYPAQLKETNGLVSKTIYVQFTVGNDGILRDIKILKGIDPAFDKEAIRVVKMMPKWKPGKQNGKTVSVIYTMPIKIESN